MTDKIQNDPNHLFTLIVKRFQEPCVVIYAFDGGFQRPNHNRINVEVRQGGKVIFPRGVLYCATPGCTDDDSAKELVMSLIAMRPGDTDDEYFEGYTPAQREWATRNGEELSCEREARYCDENGNGNLKRRA
jgi:hypothetical protein